MRRKRERRSSWQARPVYYYFILFCYFSGVEVLGVLGVLAITNTQQQWVNTSKKSRVWGLFTLKTRYLSSEWFNCNIPPVTKIHTKHARDTFPKTARPLNSSSGPNMLGPVTSHQLAQVLLIPWFPVIRDPLFGTRYPDYHYYHYLFVTVCIFYAD